MAYRKDKNITKEIPSFRKILNFLTANRNDAIVYFKQTIDVTELEKWLDEYHAKTGRKLNFLHVYMTYAGLQLHEQHRLNRYVCGNRFYQRDGVTVSVSAKKKKENGGKIVLLKVPVLKDDTVGAVTDRFLDLLGEGREKENIYQEKEMNFFTKLPPFVLKGFLKLAKFLDRYHLLPGKFVDPDPLYTSIVIANIGSVGLEAAYHHLYDYGNCPFFAMIGCTKDQLVIKDGTQQVRRQLEIKYAFDERVEDGLACAFGLEKVKKAIENPYELISDLKSMASNKKAS